MFRCTALCAAGGGSVEVMRVTARAVRVRGPRQRRSVGSTGLDTYNGSTKGVTPVRSDVLEAGPVEFDESPDERWQQVRPRRRVDRRTRSILAFAAVAAVVVNAGAAWIYWGVTGAQTGTRAAGAAVQLSLRARSDDNTPLTAGGNGNLTVTLTNDHDFPVKITSVERGDGRTLADDEHRDAGCDPSAVSLSRNAFDVRWSVPKNTIGAFTIPDGLTMGSQSDPACAGATFTLPIRVSGMRQAG